MHFFGTKLEEPCLGGSVVEWLGRWTSPEVTRYDHLGRPSPTLWSCLKIYVCQKIFYLLYISCNIPCTCYNASQQRLIKLFCFSLMHNKRKPTWRKERRRALTFPKGRLLQGRDSKTWSAGQSHSQICHSGRLCTVMRPGRKGIFVLWASGRWQVFLRAPLWKVWQSRWGSL